MLNPFRAREEAFRLANSKYVPGNTTYTEYSSIYLGSTSNVKGTMSLYKGYESVLAIGGTGAHGFEAALNGAKRVDMFDVNFLQYVFYEYIKTAIMFLSYEEFITYFTLKEQSIVFKKKDIANLLANELYQKLALLLPDEVDYVLEPLFDYFYSPDLILSALFRFEHIVTLDYLKKFVSFYNKEEYYRLQQILRTGSCDINYYQASVEDIPKKFKGKYDLIVLDNVLQYYSQIRGMETAYKVNMFINKELAKLLTDDGVIQAAYGYEVATDALKMSQGIPFTACEESKNFISQLALKKEQKEGICTQLVKRWDNYTYDFIPGVEEEENKLAENVVLTYRKRK